MRTSWPPLPPLPIHTSAFDAGTLVLRLALSGMFLAHRLLKTLTLARSRKVAIASLPILAGSLLVHAGNGWLFSGANGGWEYPLYLIATAVAVALLGGGRIAVTRSTA